MFDFVKNLFGGGYEKLIEKQAELDEYEADIKRMSKNNIAEPVISFVQAVKKNPGWFQIDGYDFSTPGLARYLWSVFDMKTGERFYIESGCGNYTSGMYGKVDWLTREEEKFITRELDQFFEGRKVKMYKLLAIRQQKRGLKERQRLMSIYCKENA